MKYRITAYRTVRRSGVMTAVVTATATAGTLEKAAAISKEFADGHPDCVVEVREIINNTGAI